MKNPNSFTLAGFGPNQDITYTFSRTPSASFKWGVAGPGAVSSHGAVWGVQAWAKTQRQAHEYADRHGMRREGYAVSRLWFIEGKRA